MSLDELKKICQRLRFDIVTSTTNASAGHPTSSLSAVELMAVLFFGGILKYDFKDPKNISNDRVIFSKGHASPLLYSLYEVAGAISYEQLMTLRKFGSNLEGHPTPHFSFVDVATGSLGQGLSIGVGMAIGLKYKFEIQNSKFQINTKSQIRNSNQTDLEFRNSDLFGTSDLGLSALKQKPRVFVLLGDSEVAEGQVWEAAEIASYYKLNNLIAILDVNRLGQRGETMLGWDLAAYEKRFQAFGWNTIVIQDGNDLQQVNEAFKRLTSNVERPTIIIAKTIKGKGVSFLEDKEGWHGKAIPKEMLAQALKEIGINKPVESAMSPVAIDSVAALPPASALPDKPAMRAVGSPSARDTYRSPYRGDGMVATREAYGDALVSLGQTNPQIVVLDAETSNSTFAEKFKKIFPDRFFEMFIAEQNMVSSALGMSKLGLIPFVSSFAAFLTRAFDQIRMAQYSGPNLKIVGSHAGVSIGSDGSTQMGLEDLAMARSILESVVFYPSDAVSTLKLVEIMAKNPGLFYLRTTREKTPVIYSSEEEFKIGGSKIIHQSDTDKVMIIASGITLHQSLKAYQLLKQQGINTLILDIYCIKPLDAATINREAKRVKNVIVVEDHYPAGGIGEAVKSILTPEANFIHLCVKKTPCSGSPEELLRYEEIDAATIVRQVNRLT